MYKKGLKRGLDFIIVFVVLLVIWPILFLLVIFLHFANKGTGVFFTQIVQVKMLKYLRPLSLRR